MKLDKKMAAMTAALPRGEYPRPECVRDEWLCLNGAWRFERDPGASGRERHFERRRDFADEIQVPFCPESALSGLGYTDFMAAVWYQKQFILPESWQGKRVLAHFDAVDYEAFVYVNDTLIGGHRGGYIGFTLDISDALRPGENVITLCAEDDVRSRLQPAGKQSDRFFSHDCSYTRTTGIWQSVWLEPVEALYVKGMKLTPDLAQGCLAVEAEASCALGGARLVLKASYEGKPMGEAVIPFQGPVAKGMLPLHEVMLWEAGAGRLYDLEVSLEKDGVVSDRFDSYFGMRSVGWGKGVMTLNGKPLFQRLILDQGFYPDGIYTAPNDGELKADIERSMAMGFNGARLHQKIFEPRFLYWADKLGYLVWGEQASWVLDYCHPQAALSFLPEWVEAVRRDINHPALVGWCPYNETWDRTGAHAMGARNLLLTYEVTKALDPTRPVIDTSGGFHVKTDIYDIHDYCQDPETFKGYFAAMAEGGEAYVTFPQYQPGPESKDQPYFVSEYGGIRWAPEDSAGWGYGEAPKSEEAFIARYRGLTHALLDNPAICAFCYTQLTDVEQEVNGLYTYDRKPKFDPAVIRAINEKTAAIER